MQRIFEIWWRDISMAVAALTVDRGDGVLSGTLENKREGEGKKRGREERPGAACCTYPLLDDAVC